MSKNDRFDVDRAITEDARRKQEKAAGKQEMVFAEYLKLVQQDPQIAQNTHARVLEQVLSYGVETISEAERWLGIEKRYPLIASKLFGIEKPTEEIMNYLEAGAEGLPIGKQILLIVGPTASGKSTFVNILKHALEQYHARPVFMIKGCSLFDEPLHLLPRHLRDEFFEKTNIRIRGDLCPHCRYRLMEEYKGEWARVPVETFTFSIQGTRGIGSFEPSDEKSSDVSELVGRENIAISSRKGTDHPLAYSLSGELEKANRGIFEGRELIKADEKLLWVLISAAEEGEIKVQGSTLPHISVDVLMIGHTNLTEYRKFAARQENEALHDRMYVVAFPYLLRVKDEVALYRKLIQSENDFSKLRKCHVAPGTLEMAAIFAVLSRLTDSQMGVDALTKLKLYNGDKALTEIQNKEKMPVDLRALIEEGQASPDVSKREGMFGISPRDVLAALNTSLVAQKGKNGCLTPLRAVRAIREIFEHRMGYTPEEIERFKTLLVAGEGGSVMIEYRNFAVRTVSRAFLHAYDDLKRDLFHSYIREIEFYRETKRKFVRGQTRDIRRDELTGKPKEPNMKLMRGVEEQIPIVESEAEAFRGEILEFKASNPNFSYDTYQPLAEAIDKKLLHDSRAFLMHVLDPNRPRGEEEKKRVQDLFGALKMREHCEVCARELVEKASEFLRE
ncbi:MAG: hypothetical protein HYS44_01635 [Candidatus Niyogibacteria bacterium]|nr:hypothetical protein [Candidatus Niyogibacteria bacterium]